MTDKRALLDELIPLMRENGTEPELLLRMQEPDWIEEVSEENLRFLLKQHRSLQEAHGEAEGLYERWMRAKGQHGPDA